MEGLTQRGITLVALVRERDGAASTYSNYQSVQGRDKHLALSDKSIYEPMWLAYTRHKELAEKVAAECKEYFDLLPEALQFGVKNLGKPLVLASSSHMFRAEISYCLIVKAKPIDKTALGWTIHSEPEYTYDVQALDLAKL